LPAFNINEEVSMNSKIQAVTIAAALSGITGIAYAQEIVEPTPISATGTIIALLVMAALIVVPIIWWFFKADRNSTGNGPEAGGDKSEKSAEK